MRITIITVGSRGDVQPCVALGLGLKAAGHQVCLVTMANFETLVRSHGLDFYAAQGNAQEIAEQDAGRAWVEASGNPVSFVRGLLKVAEPLLRQFMIDCWNACQGAEAIMFSGLGFYAAYHIAEKMKIPFSGIYLQPISPTRDFPSTLLPTTLSLGSMYNRLTHVAITQLFWQLSRPLVNDARQEILGLPPLPIEGPFRELYKQHRPIFYGFSPAVVPKPADWGGWVHITGYWFLDQLSTWQPSPALLDFLAAGPPPVYVGFGSMSTKDPEEMTELVVQSLKKAKQRGILLTGWGGMSNGPVSDDIFKVDSIPHDWIFPRVSAVVHHGGAGTTAAGLRAGRPTLVVPFLGDQTFWGRRVYDLGAGPKPVSRKKLTLERLSYAIALAVNDPQIRQFASNLGEDIRAEDGVARAVEAFHKHLPEHAPSRTIYPVPVSIQAGFGQTGKVFRFNRRRVIDYTQLIKESDMELAALEERYLGEPPAARVQLLRLLKSGDIPSPRVAAPLLGYTPRQARRWWDLYRNEGLVAVLKPKGHLGSTSRRSRKIWSGLKEEMNRGNITTIEQAQDYLQEQGNKVSRWRDSRGMRGIRWLFKKGRLKPLRPGRRKTIPESDDGDTDD